MPGVNDTPRRTSPDPAERTVVKCSGPGSVVAPTGSVVATSLFGSAPWSPLPLTVEVIAANVCFEPIVGTLLRRELGIRAAAASGDTVTPVLARVEMQEWEWARAWTIAFVRFACVEGGSRRREPRRDHRVGP